MRTPLPPHSCSPTEWQDEVIAQATEGTVQMTIDPGIYEHFKGRRYEVFGTTRHSETEEVFVSYRKLYDDYTHWVRPLEMFTELVERDGYSGPRFRRIA